MTIKYILRNQIYNIFYLIFTYNISYLTKLNAVLVRVGNGNIWCFAGAKSKEIKIKMEKEKREQFKGEVYIGVRDYR